MLLYIGGFRLEFRWLSGELLLPREYTSFVATEGVPDVVLDFKCDFVPDLHKARKIFESGGLWRLYHQERHWIMALCSHVLGVEPYQVSIFTDSFTSGDVYVRPDCCIGSQMTQPQYPLDEFLITCKLAQGTGMLLHASLVDDGDRGWLFAGQSGAGKSTMAGLWERAGVTGIYSDDRVIVREHEGQFWAYGTPWHGTGRYASPKRVPLSGIFVLRQAPDNATCDLPPMQAVSQLFARSFPTFWNREGLDFTVGFLQRLCAAVPCRDLGFRPTEEIVAFVRRLNGSS